MSYSLRRDARTATGQPHHHGDYLISGYKAAGGYNLKDYADTPEGAEAAAERGRANGYTGVKITELEK